MLRSVVAATCISLFATAASAQVTPAAGYTPPDDTPSVSVGGTLYPNYTYQTSPRAVDADGNTFHKNSFDVSRAYININGKISHIVGFRITPDISRETNAASSLNGSLEFRVKYAYLQTNFDDWMPRGSYARFGIQQTPYIDYTEGIYRYRFQGTTFAERNGYFASADAGVGFHYNFPSNYGDIQTGIFNGENYNKAETNNQKAFMFRGSVRPFATGAPIARGFRATFFYDGDNYQKSDERKRLLGQATFEQKYVVAGFEYLDAKDQLTAASPDKEGKGYSVWLTPRAPMADGSSVETLIRYDHLTPDHSLSDQHQNRTIVGIAYWFPHTGGPISALLLDYDGQTFDNFPGVPVKLIGIHGLVNF